MSLRIEQSGPDVRIAVKAVPGASRDQIAGAIGDRLKVRVSAPPEGGRANKAICRLIANAIRVKPGRVSVEVGRSNPEKTILITEAVAGEVRSRLNVD